VATVREPEPKSVEALIQSLTAAHVAPRPPVRELVERVKRDVDVAAADLACDQLFEHLTLASDDESALEALIVLGLAYPDLLARHRISMPQEGRRLAVLLEKRGDAERAQSLLELLLALHPEDRSIDGELSGVMKRSGSLERLVERHLSRAEEAMRDGRREDAINWLREVLALDRSRRDVARMIRDLRYEEEQRRTALRRRIQRAVAIVLVVGAATAAVMRNNRIDERYAALPAAADNDADAMRARLAAIDELVDESPLWLGMWAASRERTRLRTAIDRDESKRAELARKTADERARRETQADAERTRARMAAERSEFAEALVHLQGALQHAPPEWPHRAQVERDIQAILEWQRSEAPLAQRGSTR
jgi:tetratricopeptide (TPR) repeat protein